MTVIRKLAASSGEGPEFVLSDATVDRYGDIVEPAGWDLTNFLANPIALFGHSNNFPIGRWSDVRVEGGKLIAKLNLAAKGTSARIDELISLVEQETERYRMRYNCDPVFAQRERDKKTALRERIGFAYQINERYRFAFRNECDVSFELVELLGYSATGASRSFGTPVYRRYVLGCIPAR